MNNSDNSYNNTNYEENINNNENYTDIVTLFLINNENPCVELEENIKLNKVGKYSYYDLTQLNQLYNTEIYSGIKVHDNNYIVKLYEGHNFNGIPIIINNYNTCININELTKDNNFKIGSIEILLKENFTQKIINKNYIFGTILFGIIFYVFKKYSNNNQNKVLKFSILFYFLFFIYNIYLF